MAPPIDFCTLGMFIIDDIHPSPTSPTPTPHLSIPGGAGTFAALGARLLSPPPHSTSIAWIIDTGPDFPSSLRNTLEKWQTAALFRPREGLTTRGWNGYTGNDHREFKYLTPKLRLTPSDLTEEMVASRSFHMVCSPLRCVEIVKGIWERLRERHGGGEIARPVVVWEPVGDLCVPGERERLFEAARCVDVVSPNHEELGGFFGFEHGEAVDFQAVQMQANKMLARGVGPNGEGAVVVRCGKEGCFVATLNERKILPAYHQDSSRVVDPTGGGNGLLGGLTVGMVRNDRDVVEAARWGSVAASFCIEQVGVPTLQTIVASATCTDELWNEESVSDRLKEFRERTR